MKKMKVFGLDEYSYFWHKTPNLIRYAEILEITFGCQFDHQDFPFDKQVCNMGFHFIGRKSEDARFAEPVAHFRNQDQTIEGWDINVNTRWDQIHQK